MSDSENPLEELKEWLYDQFVESMERLGYNHPLPPKLLDFFLKKLDIKMNISVDNEIRRILGPYAVEPRQMGNNRGHSSDLSQSEPSHDQTTIHTSLAPQIFNDVSKICRGPFKGTFCVLFRFICTNT
jgi:hypothetical protein